MSAIVELTTAVRACHICKDLPLGPNPIFQLHKDAKILIAGQAPGRITHQKGRPFDDPSGERLRKWLGIDQATFYAPEKIAIIPMGFCYPGTGASGDLPPRAECAATWRKPLLNHLPNLKLTLIIGRYAIDWHLPEERGKTITDITKNWKKHWPNTFVLPHPSPRNNRWLKQNPWFETALIPRLQTRVKALL